MNAIPSSPCPTHVTRVHTSHLTPHTSPPLFPFTFGVAFDLIVPYGSINHINSLSYRRRGLEVRRSCGRVGGEGMCIATQGRLCTALVVGIGAMHLLISSPFSPENCMWPGLHGLSRVSRSIQVNSPATYIPFVTGHFTPPDHTHCLTTRSTKRTRHVFIFRR